jgi:hypothetical protein
MTSGAVAGAKTSLKSPAAGAPVKGRGAHFGTDAPAPLSPQRKRGRAPKRDPDPPQVVNDLPRPVPVTRAELDVIETFLGDAITALLRDLSR